VVCGVNGAAVGAGMSLALAADLRIGCTKKSRFLASFVKLGLGGEVPINLRKTYVLQKQRQSTRGV